MKALVSSLLFASLSFASVCEQISSMQEIHDIREAFPKVGESKPILPKALFDKYIGDFGYDECLTSIKQEVFKASDELVFLYYTNEDHCDGGNSFGSIVDEQGKVIGSISDSFIDC